MFIASGPLYTERLILRAFRDSDLDDIARFEARPDVIRYLYWVAEDREGLRERLTRRLAMDRIQAAGDAMMLAVERQDSGAVIGHVMLSWASTEHMQGERSGSYSTPSSRAGASPRRPRRSCCRSGTSGWACTRSSAGPTPATPGPSR